MPTRPLIDAGTIARRVAELGQEITEDYRGQDLVVVPVLKGSYMFAADLVRQIDLDVAIDFLGVRSYGDQRESSGVVQITTDLSHSIEGKHVILLEDIVDTGLTVAYLHQNLTTRQPASLTQERRSPSGPVNRPSTTTATGRPGSCTSRTISFSPV